MERMGILLRGDRRRLIRIRQRLPVQAKNSSMSGKVETFRELANRKVRMANGGSNGINRGLRGFHGLKTGLSFVCPIRG
jgi:hypothetical protein